MSAQDILGQDEIDALVRGVQQGAIADAPAVPADILPTDVSGSVTLFAEDIPMFRGVYGQSGGQHALQLSERVGRSRLALSRRLPGPVELT